MTQNKDNRIDDTFVTVINKETANVPTEKQYTDSPFR
jgi:hypothetical protein